MSDDLPIEKSLALTYVEMKGWEYTISGDNQIVSSCPLCGKVGKFYMSILTSCWDCKVCGRSGNLKTLRKELGDPIQGVQSMQEGVDAQRATKPLPDLYQKHKALIEDSEVMDFLVCERGYSFDVIEKMQLGLGVEGGGKKWLIFPYVNAGNYVYAKMRSLPPAKKEFLGTGGRENPLYNADTIHPNTEELIFVEGEGDCLAMLSHGYTNTIGVPGANMKKVTWIDRLDVWWDSRAGKHRQIYILYDADKVGQEAAAEIVKRISIERCKLIKLPAFNKTDGTPGKDICEWFHAGHTNEEFEAIKSNAKMLEIKGVMGMSDALDEIENDLRERGTMDAEIDTPWEPLNKIFGGADYGDVVGIMAEGKVGKMQRIDSNLLTPSGWTKIGNAKVGQLVSSLDGQPSRIEGVYPQGLKESFRVTFSDGRSTSCGIEHLWKVGSVKNFTRDGWKIVNTKMLVKMIEKNNDWFIPTFCGEFGSSKEIGIDPWVLGALLGDGGLTEGVGFTNEDPILLGALRKKLNKCGCLLSYRGNSGIEFSVRGKVKGDNSCLVALRNLGIAGKLSLDKFIPEEIKLSDRVTRLNFLRGLMDTDGSVEGKYRVPCFNSSSRRLAEDVQTLVRSMGGTATITNRIPAYTYRGKKLLGHTAYRVFIKLNNDSVFLHSRKVSIECKRTRSARLRVMSIKSEGVFESVCIKVSHPSQLYITDDYVVTHNTTFAMNWLDYVVDKLEINGLLLCFEMSQKRIARKWASFATATEDSKFDHDTIQRARNIITTRKADLVLGYTSAQNKDTVFDLIRQTVRRYATRVVVVDNLQLMVRGIRDAAQETSVLTKAIKDLAMELGIVILLVIQPKRVEANEIVAARHAAGSAAIEKDCDSILCLHRNREGVIKADEFEGFVDQNVNFKPWLLVRVDLSRYAAGGATTLYMDGAKSTIRVMTAEENRAPSTTPAGCGIELPVEGQSGDL